MTVAGGFFLASKGSIDFSVMISLFFGVALIIASGCVLNNFIDRDIDKIMERTKNRVLVTGAVSGSNAILFATVLGIAGGSILYLNTNLLTLIIALTGLFVYVIVYSLWAKRYSIYGTLIGSISGSVPSVAGYCAGSNCIDLGAILLFLILSFWQMPHSYAIAIYRLSDYTRASIPVLPAIKGIVATKFHMLLYIIGFFITTTMLTVFHYTGFIYLVVVGSIAISWLFLAILGFSTNDNKMIIVAGYKNNNIIIIYKN